MAAAGAIIEQLIIGIKKRDLKSVALRLALRHAPCA